MASEGDNKIIGRSFTPLQAPDEIIREIVFPVVAIGGDGKAHASGTAVVIAPNLMLTARHVITDFAEMFGTKRTGTSSAEATFEMFVHQMMPKGAAIWRVVQIWFSDMTDGAVLLVQPYSELAAVHAWRYPPLRLKPPQVGEQVVGFGFHSSSALNNGKMLNWEFKTATTVGVVTQVHDQRRDQRLPFPCFETTARIDGGMSGGPFFTYADPSNPGKGMRLVGLACSSFPPFDDGASISWVASLWPLMGTLITAPLAVGAAPETVALLDIVRETAEGADKLTVLRLEGGGVQVLVSA